MIIVGYQGIGKTTLAADNYKYVDLESSNFFVDGKRAADWAVVYCNIAESLSSQGRTVFVSSHQVVRLELARRDVERAIIHPALGLKDAWVEKLHKRYLESSLETITKNRKAWQNAEAMYEESIRELKAERGFTIEEITGMDYNLQEIIDRMKEAAELNKAIRTWRY